MNTSFAPWAVLVLLSANVLVVEGCGTEKRPLTVHVAEGGGNEGGSTTAGGNENGGSSAGDAAGGAAGSGGPIDFTEHRFYRHLDSQFETVEDCLKAQNPEFFINCYKEVDFCPDGSVILVLTDVQEQGSYVVASDVIEGTWPDGFDSPEKLEFDIVSPRHLKDRLFGWDWLLVEEETSRYCP